MVILCIVIGKLPQVFDFLCQGMEYLEHVELQSFPDKFLAQEDTGE